MNDLPGIFTGPKEVVFSVSENISIGSKSGFGGLTIPMEWYYFSSIDKRMIG